MERTKIYYIHYGNNIPIYVGKSNRIQGRISNHRKRFGSDIIIEILDDPEVKNKFKNIGLSPYKLSPSQALDRLLSIDKQIVPILTKLTIN